MKVKVPYYFDKFKCIAGSCESTCCANWEVVIDDYSLSKYKAFEGSYRETLHSRISKNDEGEDIFLLKGNRCSFLKDDNTCDMYINIGEDSLCYTCTQYPRFIEYFLDLKEIGLSLSCPEACRIILRSDKPLSFKLSTNNEEVSEESLDDRQVLDELLESRDIILEIIEDYSLSISKKLALILTFGSRLQTKVDLGDMDEIPKVIEDFKDFKNKDLFSEVLEYIDEDEISLLFTEHNIREEIIKYLEVIKNLKTLSNDDPLEIESSLKLLKSMNSLDYLEARKGYSSLFKDKNFRFRNILSYFIYRYFLKGFFDFDISSKIKISVISTLLIRELSIIKWIKSGELLDSDLVKICYTYSKNIEHLDENIESLQDTFESLDIFAIKNILNLID